MGFNNLFALEQTYTKTVGFRGAKWLKQFLFQKLLGYALTLIDDTHHNAAGLQACADLDRSLWTGFVCIQDQILQNPCKFLPVDSSLRNWRQIQPQTL